MPQNFADLGVPTSLTSVLERSGITTPTPIQTATLPDSLAGRDVLGRGRTGSGKTLAFGELGDSHIRVTARHIVLIHADPRRLLVARVRLRDLRAMVDAEYPGVTDDNE